MEYVKWLLLSMSLIATMMTSPATARRHGHPHRHFSHGEGSPELNGEMMMMADDSHPARDRRHGRGGHHGHRDQEPDIPGYPMKGPPSAPFVFPAQGRGPPGAPMGAGGGMHGPARDNFPAAGNTYPDNNFQQPPRNAGPQNPLRTNNFPTNANPTQFPNNNNLAPSDTYNNNPFLTPGGKRPQGNFIQRPPQAPASPPSRDLYGNNQFGNTGGQQLGPQVTFPTREQLGPQVTFPTRDQALKPNQNVNINNPPSIEPVTNELPTSATTSKPTINPRQFDLLYGSNLHEESQAKRQQPQTLQPEGKSLDPDAEGEMSIGTRILLDSTKHCQEGFVLVGDVCRRKV